MSESKIGSDNSLMFILALIVAGIATVSAIIDSTPNTLRIAAVIVAVLLWTYTIIFFVRWRRDRHQIRVRATETPRASSTIAPRRATDRGLADAPPG